MISSFEHLSTRAEACTRTEERAALLLLQGRARGAVGDREEAKEVILNGRRSRAARRTLMYVCDLSEAQQITGVNDRMRYVDRVDAKELLSSR